MKSRILSLSLYHSSTESHYNLWNLLSMRLSLLTYMMNTVSNVNVSSRTDDSELTANSHVHMKFMPENSHDYSSFDMHLVSNYINCQIIYYYIFSTISAAEQAWFQQLMKQCKISLDLLDWNNTFNKNKELKDQEDSHISENSNSDCSALLLNYKRIKINLSDILKLAYNSIIAQYNNWLINLKTDFDEDSARFSISCQKIILTLIILNKQLKIMFNSISQNSLILSCHWHKFEHWFQDVVLHDDSDKLKLLKEFIIACQILKKNSNQFYL